MWPIFAASVGMPGLTLSGVLGALLATADKLICEEQENLMVLYEGEEAGVEA